MSKIMLSLFLIFHFVVPVMAEVYLWEDDLVIPTYPVKLAEKNPIFYTGRTYQGAKGPIYPYPLYNKLSKEKKDQTYRVVYLENRYVKFSILPEIGGRIFSGLDKTNNYDFFYRQSVIKPALIGMIGAWISGGVEWNLPHHHRASTFLPIDFRFQNHPDGSKTLWIGELELRHRMRWIIGMTLYPDKSYLEVTIRLFNRTPLPHSMLYFANVAVHANEDYQVIFPPGTEYGTQHAKKEFIQWPIANTRYAGVDFKNVDVSWWKNHPRPISIFAWNYEDDFMGGYDHGQQAGVAYVADHHVAPGKKFFEFANGPEGRMWDKILTDTDGPYLELMAGAYSDNQPDYSWVQPGEVKEVKQYFFPIRELGGIKNANLQAAVNLDIDSQNQARLAFNTTTMLENATVMFYTGEELLFEEKVDISPAKSYVKTMALPKELTKSDVTVSLIDALGNEIISYQSQPPQNSPMPDPVEPPRLPAEITTNEELYLTGLRLEQFHSPAREPDPYYQEALRRDPYDSRANTALGILYCKRGMFRHAEKRLKMAVERLTKNYTRPKDGEALYYLGVAQQALGKLDVAIDAFNRAAWSFSWFAASHQALAEIWMKKGDWQQALGHIERSLQTNARNPEAHNLKTIILRKLNRVDAAFRELHATMEIDMLDLWAMNEIILNPSELITDELRLAHYENLESIMRGNVQSYLELAVDYGNLGLYDEAIDILNRFVEVAPDKNRVYPLIYYYLGYYEAQRGHKDQSAHFYQLAQKMPPDYCFPFRWETQKVLEHALKQQPDDARATYYLGNLLYDHQPLLAVASWEKARELNPAYAIVHRNLGLAYAHHLQDVEQGIASLETAIKYNPQDPRLYAELDALYERGKVSHAKRFALLDKNKRVINRDDAAMARYIELHLFMKKYDQAIHWVKHHHFHLWEGQRGLHDLYVDAHLLRGLQSFKNNKYHAALADFRACLEYPANLETGEPFDGGWRLPQIYYLIGTVYEMQNQQDQAKSAFVKAIDAKIKAGEMRYYHGLATQKLGEIEPAMRQFDKLIEMGEQQLSVQAELDFFAKFGEKGTTAEKHARAYYLIGLGQAGNGDKAAAKIAFQKALELDLNHLWTQVQLDAL